MRAVRFGSFPEGQALPGTRSQSVGIWRSELFRVALYPRVESLVGGVGLAWAGLAKSVLDVTGPWLCLSLGPCGAS